MKQRHVVRSVVATVGLFVGALAAFGASWAPSSADQAEALWSVPFQCRGRPAGDRSAVFCLSRQHEVLSLEPLSGKALWRHRTGAPGEETAGSRINLVSDLAIVGDYHVLALDRQTGARRWTFSPPSGHGPGVYLGDSRSDVTTAGSASGSLYAVHTHTGTLKWSLNLAGSEPTTVFAPIVDAARVYAGYTVFTAPNTGGLVAVDLATGKLLWKTPFPIERTLPAGFGGGPVAVGPVVAAAGGGGIVYGFDRENGRVRWTLPSVAPNRASPDFRSLFVQERILVTGSLTGVVTTYDLDHRKELWRYHYPREGSLTLSLSGDRDSVYATYLSGRLVSLSLADGKARAMLLEKGNDHLWPPLVLADRIILCGSSAVTARPR